jgi:hypothetical protein
MALLPCRPAFRLITFTFCLNAEKTYPLLLLMPKEVRYFVVKVGTVQHSIAEIPDK